VASGIGDASEKAAFRSRAARARLRVGFRRDPPPPREAPLIPMGRCAESDIPGGVSFGFRALVADKFHQEALSLFGREPRLSELLFWIKSAPLRGYDGGVELIGEFASSARPSKYWCRRRSGTGVSAHDLAAGWHGKSGILDSGPKIDW